MWGERQGMYPFLRCACEVRGQEVSKCTANGLKPVSRVSLSLLKSPGAEEVSDFRAAQEGGPYGALLWAFSRDV